MVDRDERVDQRKLQEGQKAVNQEAPCCGIAPRQSGRAVLKDLIHRLRRTAEDLETLSSMLPEKPSHEQDEALWRIACSIERR